MPRYSRKNKTNSLVEKSIIKEFPRSVAIILSRFLNGSRTDTGSRTPLSGELRKKKQNNPMMDSRKANRIAEELNINVPPGNG